MTPLGWLIMIVSIGSVVALTAFCLCRVLMLPAANVSDMNVAPLEIRSPDMDDAD